MKLEARRITRRFHTPFKIAYAVRETIDAVVVTLTDGAHQGHGEAAGVSYLSDTPDKILNDIAQLGDTLPDDLTLEGLQALLPPNGARNAIDCALWDLNAKRSGTPVWETLGLAPRSVPTVFTIGLEDEPEQMAAKARAASVHPQLKIKLNNDRPVERMKAIRAARPDADLVVDANQGWDFALLQAAAPRFAELGVKMIEQPLPRGGDDALEGYTAPLPLCADESCLHRGEFEGIVGRYQMVNVKLDKTGGLTEALKLTAQAKAAGLGIMVGNMAGSSLAMAPAIAIALQADFVDLDGPLLLKGDCDHGLTYENGMVHPPAPALWG